MNARVANPEQRQSNQVIIEEEITNEFGGNAFGIIEDDNEAVEELIKYIVKKNYQSLKPNEGIYEAQNKK